MYMLVHTYALLHAPARTTAQVLEAEAASLTRINVYACLHPCTHARKLPQVLEAEAASLARRVAQLEGALCAAEGDQGEMQDKQQGSGDLSQGSLGQRVGLLEGVLHSRVGGGAGGGGASSSCVKAAGAGGAEDAAAAAAGAAAATPAAASQSDGAAAVGCVGDGEGSKGVQSAAAVDCMDDVAEVTEAEVTGLARRVQQLEGALREAEAGQVCVSQRQSGCLMLAYTQVCVCFGLEQRMMQQQDAC
eukprot:1152652-Pelagomonas_calceolata.AAC.4